MPVPWIASGLVHPASGESKKPLEKKKRAQWLPMWNATSNLTWSPDLNWDCVENGVSNPIPQEGERTVFVCVQKTRIERKAPAKQSDWAHYGFESDDEYFRAKCGAAVQLASLDFLEKLDSGDEIEAHYSLKKTGVRRTEEKDLDLQLCECGSSCVNRVPDPFVMFSLCLTSAISETLEERILRALNCGDAVEPGFVMRVSHSSKRISVPRGRPRQTTWRNQLPSVWDLEFPRDDVFLDVTTGRGEGGRGDVTTKFSLRVAEKSSTSVGDNSAGDNSAKRRKIDTSSSELEIAKGLWTYKNAEMESWGANMEFIEVAQEFQGFGIGAAFFDLMQTQVLDPFKNAFFCNCDSHDGDYDVMELGMPVMSSYVTNVVGAVFLLSKCGFEEECGLEELRKEVVWAGEPEGWVPTNYDDIDPDDRFLTSGEKQLRRLVKSTSRDLVKKCLQEYNQAHWKCFRGAPVRARHRKKCTKCSKDFNELDEDDSSDEDSDDSSRQDQRQEQYYYTDDAEKYCEPCMKIVLANYLIRES